MARHDERSGLDDLFEFLFDVPSWVGPVLAAFAYVSLAWVFPWMFQPRKQGDIAHTLLSQVLTMIAPWTALGILVVWIAAELRKLVSRRRFDQIANTTTKPGERGTFLANTRYHEVENHSREKCNVQDLSWQEFEQLIGEVHRRQGYAVEHTGKSEADGGVDLRLTKDGKSKLVQCKHWKREQVGVTVVRELLGVMTSEGADAGIVATSGTFTVDAIDFATRNRITLIDGRRLEQLLRELGKKSTSPRMETTRPALPSNPGCPRCGSSMSVRKARRGASAGEKFWGCVNYPSCKGTRPINN